MEHRDLESELARVHPAGFAWAVRCCFGDRSEAEDVLHLAYVKVLDGRARFEGRSTFKTWLFGVIRRTALEQGRRRKLERFALGRWLRERVSGETRETITDRMAAAEDGASLRAALSRLSSRQQEILHLVFYQDLTIEEAAEVSGITVGTARTHYERGKARLRRLLAGRAGSND